MAGRSALWFWVPPCCFLPPPCGLLALITNLVQFQGHNFMKNSANTTLRELSNCFLWAHVIQHVVVALFREPIKWLVFDIQTRFHFACRSVSYDGVLKIYFMIFISKRKRNTLKCFVIRSSRKKQFVQQPEMPKKAMSGKRADRSFFFPSKTQEWNSFTALFPICRKDSRTAMSDSPCGHKCFLIEG